MKNLFKLLRLTSKTIGLHSVGLHSVGATFCLTMNFFLDFLVKSGVSKGNTLSHLTSKPI